MKKILKNGIALTTKLLKQRSLTYKVFCIQNNLESQSLISNIKNLKFRHINSYKKEVRSQNVDEYQFNFGGI